MESGSGASGGPSFDLEGLRRRIPILERAIPMNACSHAPQTLDAREAAERYLESWDERGMDWELWLSEVEGARAAFARLVGCGPDEVAIFSSVSHATAAVASALDLLHQREGLGRRRAVALTGAEFPTVAHVWRAAEERGTPLRRIPVREGRVDPGAVESVLDGDVLLLSAAWGYYQTGALLDLERTAGACRSAGALLYVDAYQALGTRPLDVKALGVDLLACGSLKFLMGIPGIAFLYVDRDVAERLEPAVTGWFGRADPFAFDPRTLDWAPAARRFDTGTPPVVQAYVARAGMELLLDAGLPAVEAWTRELADRLVEGGGALGLEVLGPTGSAARAPTTAFRVPAAFGGGSHAVETALRARGVLASARGPAVRLAPHFYNDTDDVDRALEALADVLHVP